MITGNKLKKEFQNNTDHYIIQVIIERYPKKVLGLNSDCSTTGILLGHKDQQCSKTFADNADYVTTVISKM